MSQRVVFEEKNWTTEQQDGIRASLDKLGMCACGSGTAYEIVLLLMERAIPGVGFYDSVEDASARWVEFGAHVLNAANLLEHGGGIGASWLTGCGEELLRFLREFGTDDEKWPEWATAEVYE